MENGSDLKLWLENSPYYYKIGDMAENEELNPVASESEESVGILDRLKKKYKK